MPSAPLSDISSTVALNLATLIEDSNACTACLNALQFQYKYESAWRATFVYSHTPFNDNEVLSSLVSVCVKMICGYAT